MDDLGPFSVRLDHLKTFDQLLDAGRYDMVFPQVEHLRPLVESGLNRAALIAAKYRPRHAGPLSPYRAPAGDDGPPPLTLACLNFRRPMRPRAVPAYADLLGARMAGPLEMLTFLAGVPELPAQFWLVAFGGSTDVLDGRLPAMALRIDGGKRMLLTLNVGDMLDTALEHCHVLIARH